MSHIFLHRGDTPFGILCTFGQKKKGQWWYHLFKFSKIGITFKGWGCFIWKSWIISQMGKITFNIVAREGGKNSFIHSLNFFSRLGILKVSTLNWSCLIIFLVFFFSKVLFFNHILGSKVQDDERWKVSKRSDYFCKFLFLVCFLLKSHSA